MGGMQACQGEVRDLRMRERHKEDEGGGSTMARSDALLLLDRKVARAQVDEEEQTADDGCGGHRGHQHLAQSRDLTSSERNGDGGCGAGAWARERERGERTQRLKEVVPGGRAAVTIVSTEETTEKGGSRKRT